MTQQHKKIFAHIVYITDDDDPSPTQVARVGH